MYRVRLSIFPNNETRCVFARLPPPKRAGYTNTSPPVNHGSDTEVISENDSLLLLDIRSELETLPPPVENSRKPYEKPGWGGLPKGTAFTLNARRQLLRIGGVLDQEVKHPSEILFLTGTIPNGYDDGRITTAAYSAWLVHSLKAWVNKHVPSKLDFYVWEYQKRGVLHLHYCVYVPDKDERGYLQSTFHQQWCRLLLRLSDTTGVDLCYSDNGCTDRHNTEGIQAYAQEIHTSAASYLAKYMCKGDNYYCLLSERKLYPPTRWYGVSRPLLRRLDAMTYQNEYVSVSQRKALTLHEDISSMLKNTSDICHTYQARYGYALTTVAYKTAHIGREQCLLNMESQMQSNTSKSSLKKAEQIHISLRAIAKRFMISPAKFSALYTQSAGQSMAKLFNGEQLNIIEAMEICDGLAWLLWFQYPNKGRTHESYQKAQERLTDIKSQLTSLWKEKGYHIQVLLKEAI